MNIGMVLILLFVGYLLVTSYNKARQTEKHHPSSPCGDARFSESPDTKSDSEN